MSICAHQLFGDRQAGELVGEVAALVDVEGLCEQRVGLRQVGLAFLLPGKALAIVTSLAFTSGLIRYSTSFQASALCSLPSLMPMPHEA